MAYEVLARKWRPQQFDDVLGQEHVTATLKNAILSNRVAHAYLLVGPRGTGKTSTARILAKALNCARGPTVTPCDQCDSCREIMAGSGLDVIEFDAASHTQVDKIREMVIDNVRYAASRSRFKIYIIDEVHMLSASSFNALLKTLEEPPPHVKFVFATTEPQKIPATILSRCQRFDLRRISAKDIVARLEVIARAEEIDIDPDALLAVARGAEGGLRDAESALDQLLAFRGKVIREEDVLAVFGLVARQTLDEMVQAILDGRVSSMLDLVAQLDAAGKDMQRLVIELLEDFRNLLVYLHVRDGGAGLDLTDLQLKAIARWAEGTQPARVLQVVDILAEAESKLRFALSKRTLIEIALIRAARALHTVSIDELVAQLNRVRDELGLSEAELTARGVEGGIARSQPPAPAAPVLPPVEEGTGHDGVALLTRTWHETVERVGLASPLARNYLRDAKPLRVEGDLVVIAFDPEFSENRSKIDFPRNRVAVEKALETVLRRKVRVEFQVLDAKSTLPGDTKFESAAEESVEASPPPDSRPAVGKTKAEWFQNPVVRKTLEMFNGDIVDIRE